MAGVDMVAFLESVAAKLDALRAALQPPEFYSVKDAAKVVGVSADHVRRAVVRGALVASNVGTESRPTYRIARADLLAWVERGKSGPATPGGRAKGRRPTPRSRHHGRRSGGRGS